MLTLRSLRPLFALALALVLVVLAHPSPAWAFDFKLSGRLQTDIRLRVDEKTVGQFYDRQKLVSGVSRNENIAKLRLEIEQGRFVGVVELDFVWIGILRNIEVFNDLSLRPKTDQYRIEAHAIYVEAADLFVEGLDIRIGHQKVMWGKGDQFNPTNNLNPNDFEDQLLFGDQVANSMIRVDYNPKSDWTISAVFIPIFKPAILPRTSSLGLSLLDRLPFANDEVRWRVASEQALIRAFGFPTILSGATPVLPERNMTNLMGAVRLAGTIGKQDIALSYFVGRSDIPQPFANYSTLDRTRRCNPSDPKDCVGGAVLTEVGLYFPRMHVLGFNMAGQFNALSWISKKIKALGYRIELGVYFPQASTITLAQDELAFGFYTQPKGEYDYYLDGRRPTTIASTPFPKWSIGLDYTFNRYIYMNLQWVHGLADEFGAGDNLFTDGYTVRQGTVAGNAGQLLGCRGSLTGQPDQTPGNRPGERCVTEILRPRIGDYVVLGLDVKLLSDKLLMRLFMILDLTGLVEEKWDGPAGKRVRRRISPFSSEGFSAVVFPQIEYNFGNGLVLAAGALLKLGKDYTKFGDPAAGGSDVWMRARYSF